MKIRDIFTVRDLNEAKYYASKRQVTHNIAKYIIKPKLKLIDELTGVKNNPREWSLLLEALTAKPTYIALDTTIDTGEEDEKSNA